MLVGPEYKYINVEMSDESVYHNAKYVGYHIEPYVNDYGDTEYYVYYDFTTFTARDRFYMHTLMDNTPWKYDLTTGEHITIEWPNEEWVPYFDVRETERAVGGTSDGTDENGISGKLYDCWIRFDKYRTFAAKDADSTILNYCYYNWCSIMLSYWVPNQQ